MSPPSVKRPAPPAPDPNWELELHAPAGAGRPPDSKDPMLAHALLHAEPDPFDLDLGEFGELERTTLPPPEAMSDHVARMMAEASRLEEAEEEGDRPTPLLDVADEAPTGKRTYHAGMAVPAPFAAPRPFTSPSGTFGEARPAGATKVTPHLGREDLAGVEVDLSDLPAVFSLEGLSSDDILSGVPVSPTAAPPSSAPAISPPFRSEDLLRFSPVEPPSGRLAGIEARIAAGDYGRALVLCEAALDEHPGDPAVVELAESCREMLYRRYLERLGAADHVPQLAMQRSALTGLALDHRAGFLLSWVDGGSTVEEIIDVSAMPRLDAVRILYELLQEGVISMASRR
jgi:hypothetical protein